jgi:hypothetical protein
MEPSTVTTTPRRLSTQVETSLQPGQTGWLDVGHAFIERRLFAPVLWADRFFADQRDTEPARSRSFVRFRQELDFTQFRGGRPGYSFGFSASLRFPSLDQRLERFRIEITGQAQDAFSSLLNPNRNAAETPPDQQYGTADAGIAYRVFETLHTNGDLGVGLMLQLPPGAYARARLRFVEPLGAAFVARQALTGFWRTDTLFGTTGSAELERPIPVLIGAFWRLSGTSTITQKSRGFEWSGDLSLIATLFLRIGGQLGFSISGATAAPVDVDVYKTYLRLRRDVWRRWVYVELQPEYQWPWTQAIGHRIGFWDVALRVEIQFQGRRALPEPEEPPGAVPHDPTQDPSHEPAHDPEPKDPEPAKEPGATAPRDPPAQGSLPASPSAG